MGAVRSKAAPPVPAPQPHDRRRRVAHLSSSTRPPTLRPPTGANSSTPFATACSVTSIATVCSNATSPTTCSRGKPPVGSASMPRFGSRLGTEPGSSDSPYSFTRHASIAAAITECWLPRYPPKVGRKLRSQVIALGREQGSTEESPSGQLGARSAAGSPDGATPGRPTSSRWAALIARIYDVRPLVCPSCGASMSIIAFITDPVPVRSVLAHLDLPTRPPPLSPARAPPQGILGFDQSGGFDPTDPEPILSLRSALQGEISPRSSRVPDSERAFGSPIRPDIVDICDPANRVAFNVGEERVSTFQDPAIGLTVEVIEDLGTGYRVRVRKEP